MKIGSDNSVDTVYITLGVVFFSSRTFYNKSEILFFMFEGKREKNILQNLFLSFYFFVSYLSTWFIYHQFFFLKIYFMREKMKKKTKRTPQRQLLWGGTTKNVIKLNITTYFLSVFCIVNTIYSNFKSINQSMRLHIFLS